MAGFSEANSVQAPILALLRAAGWTHIPGEKLNRAEEQPSVESEVVAALARLNPSVAEDPSRADEVLARLRMLTLTAAEDGLVAANRAFMEWLKVAGYLPVPMLSLESVARAMSANPFEALISDASLLTAAELPRIVKMLGPNRPLVLVGNPDQKLLSYQYLQTLPKIADSPNASTWIIPAELTKALGTLGGTIGKIPVDGGGSKTRVDLDAPVDDEAVDDTDTQAAVNQALEAAKQAEAPGQQPPAQT